MAKPIEELTALDMYREFKNPITHPDRFTALVQEYSRRFFAHAFNPKDLDYHMELIYELGFWSGNELPVPIPCSSVFHANPLVQHNTLPYAFRDGTKRMVCPTCTQAEYNHYAQQYGLADV